MDKNFELKKILFLEDEEDIRAIAEIALETIGAFDVCYCSSGQEALSKVSEFCPDLFLLDVMIPVMDGPTTLSHLRKIPGFEKTPCIFMTAKTQAYELEAYKKLGASIINKPFDPLTLADDIREIFQNMLPDQDFSKK